MKTNFLLFKSDLTFSFFFSFEIMMQLEDKHAIITRIQTGWRIQLFKMALVQMFKNIKISQKSINNNFFYINYKENKKRKGAV